jgi:hypothetical protein
LNRDIYERCGAKVINVYCSTKSRIGSYPNRKVMPELLKNASSPIHIGTITNAETRTVNA